MQYTNIGQYTVYTVVQLYNNKQPDKSGLIMINYSWGKKKKEEKNLPLHN